MQPFFLTEKNVVTSRSSGFGIMAIIEAIERGFIIRTRWNRKTDGLQNFLKKPIVFMADCCISLWRNKKSKAFRN